MGAMTLVYLMIALYRLGNLQTPQTFWQPANPGESFIINLDRDYEISRINYYNNRGNGRFLVQYEKKQGLFVPLTYLQQDEFHVFRWQSVPVDIKTTKIKVSVLGPAPFNEMVLFEKGGDPIKGFTITEENASGADIGKIKNLFDEQERVEYNPTFLSSTYFDEIYHARTAYEYLHRLEPFEITHPPLGKWILSLGIAVFGMNPFGWRIMGTLFGTAMIPLLYLFGKKIFFDRYLAFSGAFLLMFDTMHFAQTRIGTIDSYPGFFILLTYFFMADFFLFKLTLRSLFLSGLFWGLGVASKWTSFYAAPGLFFLYTVAAIKRRQEITGGKSVFYFVSFFIIVPAVIYALSYLPIITLPGHGSYHEIISHQKIMYSYHSTLEASHDYASSPASWLLNSKPLFVSKGKNLQEDQASFIAIFGNPAIFLFGIFCLFVTALVGLWKKDKKALLILTAFAFQYVPWFFIKRFLLIYHFFSAVPFLILSVVYVLKLMRVAGISKFFIVGYLALTAGLFVIFYPIISGMIVKIDFLTNPVFSFLF